MRFICTILLLSNFAAFPPPATPPMQGKMNSPIHETFDAEADFRVSAGTFNLRIHSSNTAPNLASRGIWDFTPAFRKMRFHSARNHDWALWNPGQRIVDTHFVFPLIHLDPTNPTNYYFDPTDEIIRITQEAGSKVFYRLGTSIEHSGLKPEQKHFNSLPPKDYAHYAEVLAGIIRHYTRGWANGFHYDMPCWEIWNEAENDPTCWKGPYEEFIKFFVVLLKRLKQEFPELQIGGPAATCFQEQLIRQLLRACKDAGVAPDFISWHGYTSQPDEFIQEPEKMHLLLKEEGFPNCRTAITEWHYLLSWEGIQSNMTPERRKEAMEGPASLGGIDSAAFNLAVLSGWQETSLDQAFYYGANPQSGWGFFDAFGEGNKNFHSMCMFGELIHAFKTRIRTRKDNDSVYLLGGVDDNGREGRLLVADYRGKDDAICVKIDGMDGALATAEILDHEHNRTPTAVQFADGRLSLSKNGPGSAAFMVTLKKP